MRRLPLAITKQPSPAYQVPVLANTDFYQNVGQLNGLVTQLSNHIQSDGSLPPLRAHTQKIEGKVSAAVIPLTPDPSKGNLPAACSLPE